MYNYVQLYADSFVDSFVSLFMFYIYWNVK